MGRITAISIIVVGLMLLWRMIQTKLKQERGSEQGSDAASAKDRKQVRSPANGSMVQCEQCGVYLPGKDAIQVQGVAYCCKDHLP